VALFPLCSPVQNSRLPGRFFVATGSTKHRACLHHTALCHPGSLDAVSRAAHCFDLLCSYLLHKVDAVSAHEYCLSFHIVRIRYFSHRNCIEGAEIAASLGLGSNRLPVKLKSFRTSNDGISHAFAVSTNPIQKGIILSALKTIEDNKMKIYSLGTAWLTDRSGTLHRTLEVNASGVRVVSNDSHAAEFKDIKAFFVKKLQATTPATTLPPSH